MASHANCCCEGRGLLQKANTTIASLKEDIRRLSGVVAQKNATISKYTELAMNQSRRLNTLVSFQGATPAGQPTLPGPTSSTPKQDVPWTEVVRGRQRGLLHRSSPPPPLNLSNRYSILTECAPTHGVTLSPQHRPPPPPKPAPPRRISREKPRHPPSSTQPVTLVVGSSMVRHLTLPSAETYCYPGALVADVTAAIPAVTKERPTASTLVVHVGSNDIRLQQSEKLKSDFTALINTITDTGKKCIISGPIPSVCFSDMQFSRIRQLHLWLKGLCSRANIPFADNFGSFWGRRYLFARDGRHLNRAGAGLLASNIELARDAHLSQD